MTQQPEFLLPYLLYLLGHHPDMPQVRRDVGGVIRGGGLEMERYAEDVGRAGGGPPTGTRNKDECSCVPMRISLE